MSSASRDKKKCPICGKPAAERLRPFCSRRCADIDLGRWLKGQYAIPAAKPDDEDEERPETPEAGGGKPH
jgi:endogenous inhibitor of DNA gyrase (YacG/DUF329 family)